MMLTNSYYRLGYEIAAGITSGISDGYGIIGWTVPWSIKHGPDWGYYIDLSSAFSETPGGACCVEVGREPDRIIARIHPDNLDRLGGYVSSMTGLARVSLSIEDSMPSPSSIRLEQRLRTAEEVGKYNKDLANWLLERPIDD